MKTQCNRLWVARARVQPKVILILAVLVSVASIGLYWLRPQPEPEPEPEAGVDVERLRAIVSNPEAASRASNRIAALAVPGPTLDERLGVEVSSVRLTVAGRAVDVRYSVVDPEKAVWLDDQANTAVLFDEATGAMVGMPQAPPPLEMHKPGQGSSYFVMFRNTAALQRGSTVTLLVGNARATNLTVQ